jgi:hypothetical protein
MGCEVVDGEGLGRWSDVGDTDMGGYLSRDGGLMDPSRVAREAGVGAQAQLRVPTEHTPHRFAARDSDPDSRGNQAGQVHQESPPQQCFVLRNPVFEHNKQSNMQTLAGRFIS